MGSAVRSTDAPDHALMSSSSLAAAAVVDVPSADVDVDVVASDVDVAAASVVVWLRTVSSHPVNTL